jgi:hypothetical protein
MRCMQPSDREEKCALLDGVHRVGQAGRNDEHATRGQLVALAFDVEPDRPPLFIESIAGMGWGGVPW